MCSSLGAPACDRSRRSAGQRHGFHPAMKCTVRGAKGVAAPCAARCLVRVRVRGRGRARVWVRVRVRVRAVPARPVHIDAVLVSIAGVITR